MNLIQELVDWLQSVPADFAFLLALPFLVGAAGLWAERRRGPGMRAGPRVPAASRALPIGSSPTARKPVPSR